MTTIIYLKHKNFKDKLFHDPTEAYLAYCRLLSGLSKELSHEISAHSIEMILFVVAVKEILDEVKQKALVSIG